MSDYVLWAVLCLAIAFVLFFIEIFIPSGGLLGILSFASLVGGIALLFKVDTTVGLIGAIAALLAIPFLFALAIKIWPNTPLFKYILLKTPPTPPPPAAGDAPAPVNVGDRGRTLTALRPVGTCLIHHQRLECLADGTVVEAGIDVEVVGVDGMQIKVRPL
ncbi:MAG: hypothetical protein IT442_15965 [Phycisphaeraceae bacterium]|nr:hypothetical protein [Phycisphaeraceae bacterium]